MGNGAESIKYDYNSNTRLRERFDGYKVHEWISVDERLPEDGEEVLCFLESEEMAVLFRRNNWGQYEWVDGDFATGSYDVIAWMPLPEPYKESETD